MPPEIDPPRNRGPQQPSLKHQLSKPIFKGPEALNDRWDPSNRSGICHQVRLLNQMSQKVNHKRNIPFLRVYTHLGGVVSLLLGANVL